MPLASRADLDVVAGARGRRRGRRPGRWGVGWAKVESKAAREGGGEVGEAAGFEDAA